MDPISAVTTVITLATFVKDLIDLGRSIKRSIELVKHNRRRIRELGDELVKTLYDLSNLMSEREQMFHTPELLQALAGLKEDMLTVASDLRKFELAECKAPILRAKSHFKAWLKRYDAEAEIKRLKKHVNGCFVKFTTFSVARIEYTSVRVEQTLVLNNVESQVKLQRLEGMMAQMLLDTEFGQNVLNKMVEVISTDSNHESLEYQYLSIQTMRLIESIGSLSVDSGDSTDGGHLILKTELQTCVRWNSALTVRPTLIDAGSISPLDVLHWILGAVRDLRHSLTIQAESMTYLMLNFGVHLHVLGMVAEALAWQLLKIQILRPCSDSRSLAALAVSLTNISLGYQFQNQHRSALGASQQSLDLWHHLREHSPNDVHPFHPQHALVTHAENLLQNGQDMAALSVAQEAVAICRPALDERMIECDELTAVHSQMPLFMLAAALSSLGRNLEAYEASKEAFQTIITLRSPNCSTDRDIDSFVDQICKVAEGGESSITMLRECTELFCDLAGIHPDEFSSGFLSLFYAYVYYAQQDNPPSLENLRILLEPDLESDGEPSLELDITIPIHFGVLRFTVEDAVRAFFACPSQSWPPFKLIQNLFITHFERAMVALREVIVNSSLDSGKIQWVLWCLADLVECIPKTNQGILLHPLSDVIKRCSSIIASQGSDWEWFLDSVTVPLLRGSWMAGLLAEALAGYEQAIKYLRSQADDLRAVEALWWFQLTQSFVFCDMGRLPDAIRIVRQTKAMPISEEYDGWFFHAYIIETRILRHMGRHREALQTVGSGVAAGSRKYGEAFDLPYYLLLIDLAATFGNAGKPEKALQTAERAVAACRKEVDDGAWQKCALVHSLTTFSNCLAAVGKKDEACTVSQEAVLIYTKNADDMWDDLVHTIRKEELGASAFHSLSLRLATAGDLDQALSTSEKATELYRELVSLAPRHLPTLANSLRNLASTLWKVDRREEAIAACEEAVSIMRDVVDPETYFLPTLTESLDQLASYLEEKGDVEGAFATTTECAEARRKFASLPPEPDVIFEKISEVDSDEEDEKDAEECQEIAKVEGVYPDQSQGDEEIHGESNGPGDVAAVADTVCVIPESPAPAVSGSESKHTTPDPLVVASAQSAFAEALRTPLEVRLRSTPMDILWWILIGVLFAVVFRRGV
ncbi:hypothetical protein DFH06DRAFT_692635 [Mycena polygramma]|nr:hypothetical protein DFH06DRAFT_692635 [Mycena polygramma]